MRRHRTLGTFTSVPTQATSWGTPNPKPPPQSAGVIANANGTVVVMDDSVTPGFKALQNKGVIINNSMSRTSETRSCGTGTILLTLAPKPPGRTATNYLELVNPQPDHQLGLASLLGQSIPDYSRMLAEARTRALANVAKPDFQGLVSLGEMSESLRYLKNPFKQGLKLAKAFEWRVGRLFREESKRSRREGSIALAAKGKSNTPVVPRLNPDDAKIVKELESLYLEFRYGVRPMVQEVTSALENIRERAVPRPKRQTFRAKMQQVDDASWSAYGYTGSIRHLDSYVYKRTVSVNVGFLYEFTSDYGIGDKWGLQLGQVPITLWNLASLSFVVDWGLNVGQFISALTPVPGMNRLAEWISIREEHDLSRSYSGQWYETWAGWDNLQSSTGTRSPDAFKLSTYSRVPFVGLPDLVFRQNAVETFSEAAKVLDLATLFHQRIASAFSMGQSVSKSVQTRIGRPHAASKWYG